MDGIPTLWAMKNGWPCRISGTCLSGLACMPVYECTRLYGAGWNSLHWSRGECVRFNMSAGFLVGCARAHWCCSRCHCAASRKHGFAQPRGDVCSYATVCEPHAGVHGSAGGRLRYPAGGAEAVLRGVGHARLLERQRGGEGWRQPLGVVLHSVPRCVRRVGHCSFFAAARAGCSPRGVVVASAVGGPGTAHIRHSGGRIIMGGRE